MMEAEQKDDSDNTLSNRNSSPGKRGRGRPRGSFKKNVVFVKEVDNNVRTSKKVDFFSPELLIRPKHRKRGRPKKIRIPGRPRKIPLTPEEEAERMSRLGRKRKLSKPLGRPRIHPVVIKSKMKRGRGRPRKTESSERVSTHNSSDDDKPTSLQKATKPGEDAPRKRGRPHGSFKKKRGRPQGFSPAKRLIDGVPVKRGRPPGSGVKLQPRQDASETPRKRGRPPGSGNKLKSLPELVDGTPRKRGRPPGSGNKVKVAKQTTNGVPRKRGRPPGSGIKVQVKSQDSNGAPRKRGRPPGSAKAKPAESVSEIEHAELSSSSSVVSVSAQPRKRGRPKKVSHHKASKSEEDSEVNDAPSPKRARSSSASETEADAEDQNSSENEADHGEETLDDEEVLDEGEKHVSVFRSIL
ncbi:RNA polymerase-associated protein CTR9 homolog isoform X2 [Trichomycterus rosablanca]|uniref:RNA polymerase-associated protein CTR9 homolog isoform X2 n=1 Tax=Trichomycterus rosablanca TaxID=2290929 RepID=UPI002F35BB1C